MKPYEKHMLDKLLRMSLNGDVFERILAILEQEQHREMEKVLRNPES
ncbi:MAG: hypothetical protein HY313_08220 [Acidobacteria bacterium]|nr:hypothetical protein [Acidobacteriota bacterium]